MPAQSNVTALRSLLLVLFLALVKGNGALADQGEKAPKRWKSVYVGVSLVWQSIGGDFDGQTFYASGLSVVVVPEVYGGQGLTGFLGFRGDHVGIEINYAQTAHGGQWAQIATDETYHRVGMAFPVFLKSRQRFQPLLTTGVYVHWLTVEDGSFEFSEDLTAVVDEGNAQFIGLGGSLGVGFAYYVAPRLGIRLQLGYDLSFYGNISGVGAIESMPLTAAGLDNISGNGWSTTLGIMLGL